MKFPRAIVGLLFAALPLATAAHAQPPTVAAAPATLGKLDIAPAAFGRLPWVVFDERSGLPQHTIVDLQVDAQLYASKEGGRHRATYVDEAGASHTILASG